MAHRITHEQMADDRSRLDDGALVGREPVET
jgi:hypothetical protein